MIMLTFSYYMFQSFTFLSLKLNKLLLEKNYRGMFIEGSVSFHDYGSYPLIIIFQSISSNKHLITLCLEHDLWRFTANA